MGATELNCNASRQKTAVRSLLRIFGSTSWTHFVHGYRGKFL